MPPRRKLGSLTNFNIVGYKRIEPMVENTPAPTLMPTARPTKSPAQREQERIAYQEFLDEMDREKKRSDEIEMAKASLRLQKKERREFKNKQEELIKKSQNATEENTKQKQNKKEVVVGITGLPDSRFPSRRFL